MAAVIAAPVKATLDFHGTTSMVSLSHEADEATKWAVAVLYGGPQDYTATVTYGGVAMTHIATYRYGFVGNGDTRCRVYALTEDVPTGTQTFAVTPSASVEAAEAIIYTGTESVSVVDSGTAGGLNTTGNVTLDAGSSSAAMAFAAVGAGSDHPTLTGLTEDDDLLHTNGWGAGGHSASFTGSLVVGMGYDGQAMTAALAIGMASAKAHDYMIIG